MYSSNQDKNTINEKTPLLTSLNQPDIESDSCPVWILNYYLFLSELFGWLLLFISHILSIFRSEKPYHTIGILDIAASILLFINGIYTQKYVITGSMMLWMTIGFLLVIDTYDFGNKITNNTTNTN